MFVLLLAGGGAGAAQETKLDEARIRAVLLAMFDKPDAPLTVDPVVARGDYAVADWMQGGAGGRALLRRRDGVWSVVLCGGDALKAAERLERAGVPAMLARALASDLAVAEGSIIPERRATLSRFPGEVILDATGSHPVSGHHR